MPLSNTAVVTGAAAGIGLAAARELLESDATLRLAAIDLNEASALLDDFPDRVLSIPVDVRDIEAVEDATARVESAFGTPTRLVCSAGIQLYGDAATIPRSDFDRVMDVNLGGVFNACQCVGKRMVDARHGAIVNIASIAMFFGLPRRLPYITAKAGVGGLTQTLAVEWAPHGVRVNAVAPGMIETELVKQAFDAGLVSRDEAAAQHAMKRLGTPVEVAKVTRFLLSDDASFVTGEIVCVDGGFRLVKT